MNVEIINYMWVVEYVIAKFIIDKYQINIRHHVTVKVHTFTEEVGPDIT